MNGVEEPPEEGEFDSNGPAPTKVHLRGLDNLNQNHVRQYAEEHYSLDLFTRVQWVDDTSANLVYDTEIAAAEALAAFSAEDFVEPLQLRRAKPFSAHPDMVLEVRQAIVADVKIPQAKDRSRFYLLNPEWDPDSRQRKRRLPEHGYGSNKYRRHDRGGHRLSRRQSRDVEFHEEMYDERPRTADMSRRSSGDSGYGRRRVQYEEAGDLMPKVRDGRLRDRSASPVRDGDGRFGFAEEYPRRRTPPPRSRTPQGIRGGRNNYIARDQRRVELFPDRRGGSALARSQSQGGNYEARPIRPRSAASSRELFPDKVNGVVHRRQDAKDLHPDEVANAFGRHSLNPAIDQREQDNYRGPSGRRPEYEGRGNGAGGGRDLFSRISGGPGTMMDSGRGRLQDRIVANTGGEADNGFSFKGADPGFSILGASMQRPKVKELFPIKTNSNEREDLMDVKIKGRGARLRAEDF